MELPQLTHLQYLVLVSLVRTGRSGERIRAILNKYGAKKAGPAFYQLMARLEQAGLVQGQYRSARVRGRVCKQRYYEITPAGLDAWDHAISFYVHTVEGVSRPDPEPTADAPDLVDPMGIFEESTG